MTERRYMQDGTAARCGAKSMLATGIGRVAYAECRLPTGHSHEHEVCLRFVPYAAAEGVDLLVWWQDGNQPFAAVQGGAVQFT